MTTMTEPQISREMQAATILEKSVCLTLECHYLGNNRQVDVDALVSAMSIGLGAPREDAIENGTDADQFHVTKRLIPTRELNPVMRVFGVAKAKLRAKAIATHRVFGERSYLIPLALVEETDADLVACEHELKKQARELAYRRYAAAVEKQKTALGPLFKAGDYLAPEQVVAAFAIDWSFVSFAAPDKLESVSHVLAMNAERKHTNKLTAAYDEVLVGLRASALEVMTDLEQRLTPDDGKPKVLRGAALRDLAEFIQYLPARNLTDDVELAAVMARVARRAEGLDVQTLRDSDATREALREAASEAKAVLVGLVETGRRASSARRAISFTPLTARSRP